MTQPPTEIVKRVYEDLTRLGDAMNIIPETVGDAVLLLSVLDILDVTITSQLVTQDIPPLPPYYEKGPRDERWHATTDQNIIVYSHKKNSSDNISARTYELAIVTDRGLKLIKQDRENKLPDPVTPYLESIKQ